MSDNKNILLVTVTEIEAEAVFDVFEQAIGERRKVHQIKGNIYYLLGTIGNTIVSMVRSEVGIAGSANSITTAMDDFKPFAVIFVGMAFGLRPKNQKLGDILVSRAIMSYELGSVEEDII